MRIFWRAALGAACLSCATGASAATYYSFDFTTLGYGNIAQFTSAGDRISDAGLNNITISFKTLTSTSFTPSGSGYAALFARGSLNLQPTGISFSDQFPVGRVADDTIGANACFTNTNIGPAPVLGTFQADPACGTALINFNSNAAQSTLTNYFGRVTSLTVSIVTGDNLTQSSFVNGVPEPSTWALMLVGFGMTGYTLRKRRVSVALAPTA